MARLFVALLAAALAAAQVHAGINGDVQVRKCHACAASFDVFSAKLGGSISNGDKAEFFKTRSGSGSDEKGSKELKDKITKACEVHYTGTWSDRHLKSCADYANLMMKQNLPRCWDHRDHESFCGCIVGGSFSPAKCPSPPTAAAAATSATASTQRSGQSGLRRSTNSNEDEDEDSSSSSPRRRRRRRASPPSSPSSSPSLSSSGASFSNARDKRKCQGCVAAFSVVASHLGEKVDAKEKANFFATKSGSGLDETQSDKIRTRVVKMCRQTLGGKDNLTDRELKQSCDAMGHSMMNTRGLLAQCWDFEEAPGFCGCIVAGGSRRKKEC